MLTEKNQIKILDFCKQNNVEANKEIEKILLDYILLNPLESDVCLKLIKHIYTTRPVDTLDIIDYINEILQLDPNNIYALLFLAYIQYHDIGIMDETLIEKMATYETNDLEIKGMIAIAISWHYSLKQDVVEQEQWLKKSIELAPHLVLNYYELMLLYFYNGQKEKFQQLIPFALKNVAYVFKDNDDFLVDTTDVEEFFNIYYKKIHVSKKFIEDLNTWKTGQDTPFFRRVIF